MGAHINEKGLLNGLWSPLKPLLSTALILGFVGKLRQQERRKTAAGSASKEQLASARLMCAGPASSRSTVIRGSRRQLQFGLWSSGEQEHVSRNFHNLAKKLSKNFASQKLVYF